MTAVSAPRAFDGWWAVGVFCAAAILSYTDRLILTLLVDPIRGDLNISDTQVSVLQGVAFAIIYAFAGLPMGRLADIAPRRLIIVAGVLLWSLATVACGFAQTFWQLFGARVCVGIGEAALAPAAMSMIADYFPTKRRGAATGVFLMGMVIGGGAAIAIGGALLEAAQSGQFSQLLGEVAPWRAVLMLLGAPGLLVALLLLTTREPPRSNKARADGALPLKDVFVLFAARRRVLVPLYLGLAATAIGDFSLGNWTPAYLSRNFGMSPGDIGAQLGLVLVASALSATAAAGIVTDHFAKKRGPVGRLPATVLAAGICTIGGAIALSSEAWHAIAYFALWNTMSTFVGVAGITAIQEVVPNEARGLGVSMISFLNMIFGLALGTTVTALLTDQVFADPMAVGLSMSCVAAPAGLLAFFLYWRAWRGFDKDFPTEARP